ncbi:ABC transporter permease [Rhizobium sp. RU36D]|uniref:ABC transporter permease n=1 Tax=Rhizobium sp. RU36D TaxID=1907415 RepID=UPI0009D857A1|nr:ABC transporter permease [Rhizobium sp. RU36D]SMC75860.1 peptide/nickel transport system permease protein [Rhizobium sp. RU36D]
MDVVDIADVPRRMPRPLWLRLMRNPGGAIGLALLAVLILAALLAPWIAPYSPTKLATGRPLMPPGAAHLLGTDELGRDVFSRILFGAQLTLKIGTVAVCISLVSGLAVGLAAAHFGGWLEKLLMHSTDVLFSFSDTLIALAFVAVLGPSLTNAMIAVGVAAVPFYARTAYASALAETAKPYYEGAIAAGAGHGRLILRHLLPNIMPTMIVVATLGLSNAILAAAALGFLGLGAQPPQPEWGYMLSAGRDFMNRAPWLMLYPGLAIALTVFAFNMLGDALREAIDPKSEGR